VTLRAVAVPELADHSKPGACQEATAVSGVSRSEFLIARHTMSAAI
jgi:hypothetical protein